MKICKKRNLIILLSIIIVIAVCSLYLLFKPKPVPELPDYPFFHIDWNAKRADGIISYAEEVTPTGCTICVQKEKTCDTRWRHLMINGYKLYSLKGGEWTLTPWLTADIGFGCADPIDNFIPSDHPVKQYENWESGYGELKKGTYAYVANCYDDDNRSDRYDFVCIFEID